MIADQQVNYLLQRVLESIGYDVILCQDRETISKEIEAGNTCLLIISEQLDPINGIDLSAEILEKYPGIPLILFVYKDNADLLKRALQIGVSDYLCQPLKTDDILRSIQNSLQKAKQRREWVLKEAKRATASLRRRVDEMETLARLARVVTSSLNLDSVLSAVVDAAVELTGTEEGSLLLLDEDTGELYMRASRNFQQDFVRTFRLAIKDSLAGSVLRSGKPVIIDEKAPQKIKTTYLVHSLIYVPLKSRGHVFGVLGIDNRVADVPLKEHDIRLLEALAEYAVIAIENANLYGHISQEHSKLEAILAQIEDGVIVIDQDERIVLVNQVAKSAFNLVGKSTNGMRFGEVFTQADLIGLVKSGSTDASVRGEVISEDGRIFSALMTQIPGLGLAIAMHDITHLKKLDNIKSDFVNTVSHDLRSPLTAILGFSELIERAGTINSTQKEYIHRVQSSVQSITSLVDDLLNLGRIEAGFDTRKENVAVDQLIRYTVENFRKRIADKGHNVVLDISPGIPPVFANPIQMRQMVENLLDNTFKYTPAGGLINIRANVAQNQAVIQFIDTGIGIPAIDLPYIFDKFYRSSASGDTPGTGLGLSIVRSIVENHNGRIWVDSTVGMGSTFTVVLPLAN
ncbi:MAG TPA: ATP-binding protein [Anaerolineaceae bacterium]|nr:ATP-binding protein [Anaerolineaceae bacterium]